MPKTELAKIKDEASRWVILNEKGLTPKQEREFSEWLKLNPKHGEHYARHKSYWSDMDRLAGLQLYFKKNVDPDLLEDEVLPHTKKRRIKPLITAIAGLAACLLIVFSISYFRLDRSLVEPTLADEFKIERIQKLELEDDSTVFLNRSASIVTRYSSKERLVILNSGEAHFEVTKDFKRPFIVDVQGVKIRAVGTAFNVHYDYNKVDVFVTEGTIAVQSPKTKTNQATKESIVEINQQVIVSLDHKKPKLEVNTLQEKQIEDMLLWKPQLIDFQNTPLVQIIDEFNRRNDIQIIIQDPDIGDIRISSVFWSDNLGGFVRLLEARFGIVARNRDNQVITLSRS